MDGCPTPEKKWYESERDAIVAMIVYRNVALADKKRAARKKRWEVRAYACQDHWHLTSRSQWTEAPPASPQAGADEARRAR